MSNLIKVPFYPRTQAESRVVIDSNKRAEECMAKYQPAVLKKSPFVAIDLAAGADIIEDNFQEEPPQADPVQAQLMEQTRQMMEDASREADTMKAEAARRGYEEGHKNGYEEGLSQGYGDGRKNALDELRKAEENLKNQMQKCREEYDSQVAALEPKFAGLVVRYVQKLTGIAVEVQENILEYLLHNAIYSADPSKYYIIHVPSGDFERISRVKEKLATLVSSHAEFDIVADPALAGNECRIETDSCMIDAGLGVQLENLVSGLKLLAGQE